MEADLRDARSGDSLLVQQLKDELDRERVGTTLPSNLCIMCFHVLYGYTVVLGFITLRRLIVPVSQCTE